MEDTIAAIATAVGVGAISIIRVSGNNAIKNVNKIFKGTDLEKVASHTINYGHIIYNDEIIDEVLVSVMRTPKTFTREDVVEINCHGGIATTNKVLELLLMNDCRLAEPGEFTKRAFLNGRIDLVEAEGIMNLIDSKSELARKLSLKQLDGSVSNNIRNLRNKILLLLANIAVNIDYPEYEDILDVTIDEVKKHLSEITTSLQKILETSENTTIVLEGLKTAIVGCPNVGKSSILNLLLNEEKAIVTNVAGTTRDIVEGTLNLNGVYLKLLDTAGIHETDDIVEGIGINKSIDSISSADLVLLVLDGSRELNAEDQKLLDLTAAKKRIIIINKVDLECKIDFHDNDVVLMSTKDGLGLDKLKNKIISMFKLDEISADMNIFVNADDLAKIKKCIELINKINSSIDFMEIDMIEIDLREINDILGSIIGESYDEELLDTIFKNFCLGK
ncbi:MAG: tRNA uridine-5-carboxymethylaminomethyl(34) synthesis GTPase MnmE [Erysipelotrichaceae bacterium]|nr:tRNA uridine-5-carboxymethylaminomethyl(34) synthesis GTPase MnmE [Erysipelotrichaceae bacterium]